MHILARACFVVLFALKVLAHDHHDALTEEETSAPVDNILWIHIFLQALVWGVIFPIGMVLGLSRSRWHVPLQVSLPSQRTEHPAHRCPSLYVYVGNWLCPDSRRLYPGPLAQRTLISRWNTRQICQHTHSPYPCPAHHRNLPEATHQREINPTVYCYFARNNWKGLSHTWLGSDPLRSYCLPRVLSWGRTR